MSKTTDTIRNQIKSMFDAKPTNDPSYIIYHMIDKFVPNNTSKKDKILRITQFFNNMYFVESINSTIRSAYLNNNNLRRGFLTNGALFYGRESNGQIEVDAYRSYNIDDLSSLGDDEYQKILNEIDEQLNNVGHNIKEVDASKEKWYFWPGCEMKIPENTTILLDTSVQKSKFVVTKKNNGSSQDTAQIVMEENPYQLEVSLLGDNEFFYKENENAEERKLAPGFFTINKSEPKFVEGSSEDFNEIDLALKKGEEYDYTLYVPYNTPRLDVLTDMKISNGEEKVEEFIATCS